MKTSPSGHVYTADSKYFRQNGNVSTCDGKNFHLSRHTCNCGGNVTWVRWELFKHIVFMGHRRSPPLNRSMLSDSLHTHEYPYTRCYRGRSRIPHRDETHIRNRYISFQSYCRNPSESRIITNDQNRHCTVITWGVGSPLRQWRPSVDASPSKWVKYSFIQETYKCEKLLPSSKLVAYHIYDTRTGEHQNDDTVNKIHILLEQLFTFLDARTIKRIEMYNIEKLYI